MLDRGVDGDWRFGAQSLLDAGFNAGLGTEAGGRFGRRFGEGFGAGAGRRARTSAHSGFSRAKLRKTSGSCDQGPKRRSKVR